MSSPEILLKNLINIYVDGPPVPGKTVGTRKNRRMKGIPVKYRSKDAVVYFYIAGARFTEFGSKFENNVRRIIETRVLDQDLLQCDYATNFSIGNCYYNIVEWTTSLRLRQAILKHGTIQRGMRIKLTEKAVVKYEFHVILELY